MTAFTRAAGVRGYAIPVKTVCREWRMKVDNEETAEKIDALLADVQTKIPQGANIERLVCKAAWDYKVQVSVPLETFGEWKGSEFAPEADFVSGASSTSGVTNVEAQSYVWEKKN